MPTKLQDLMSADKTSSVVTDMKDVHVEPSKAPKLDWEENVYDEYLSHSVHLGTYNWFSADTTGTRTLIHQDLFTRFYNVAAASVGPLSTLSNFRYFTGDLTVTVVYQGQTQAAGQLVIWFDPKPGVLDEPGPRYITAYPNRVRSKIVPHVVIDPSKSCTCEITLPCPTPEGVWYPSDVNSATGSYAIGATVFNSLISGSDAAVTDISYSIFVNAKNLKPQGMTLLGSVAEEESTKPVLSSIATAVSNAAGALSEVPVIGPFATTFSGVSSKVASVLKFFGFSKPEVQSHSHIVINRLFDNMSHVNGDRFSYNLAADEKNAISASPSFFGMGDMTDMDMRKIASIPGLVQTISIAPADANGSLLGAVLVRPTVTFADLSGEREMTPLCHMVAPFYYWHGDLTYTFEIVASMFHRGSILVAYDPAKSLTGADYNDAYQGIGNKVVSFNGNTTFEYTVPWRARTPWLKTSDYSAPYVMDLEECNGSLSLFVVNSLRSNGSTDSVTINVYVHCNNMAAMYPAVGKLTPSSTLGTKTQSLSTQIIRNYELLGDCASEMVPAVPDDWSPSTTSDIYLRFGGENLFQSTKKLASKMVPLTSFVPVSHASLKISTDLITDTNFGANPDLFGSISDPSWTYLTWYGAGYLGYRGSVGFSVIPVAWKDTNVLWVQQTMGVVPWLSSTSTLGYNEGSIAYIRREMTNNLDFTLPYYVPLYFRPNCTWAVTPKVANTATVMAVADDGTTIANRSSLRIFHGAAEDGVFVKYIGFPAFNAV